MKYLFFIPLIFYGYSSFSQSLIGKEIIISKQGAELTKEDKSLKEKSILIPEGTKLKVLDEKLSNQKSGEVEEEKEIYFKVKFGNKTGWVNGNNTNYMGIPVEVKPYQVSVKSLNGAKIIDKNVVIPNETVLKVLSMRSIMSTDKIIHYEYKVSYSNQEGWIQAMDTDNTQLDY